MASVMELAKIDTIPCTSNVVLYTGARANLCKRECTALKGIYLHVPNHSLAYQTFPYVSGTLSRRGLILPDIHPNGTVVILLRK